MVNQEFKEKLGKLIKSHGMDGKIVSAKVNAFAPKIEGDKEETILRIVEMAGKNKMEISTALLLDNIRIGSRKDADKILEDFNSIIEKPDYKTMSDKQQRERLAAKAVKAQIAWEARVQTKMFEMVVLGKSNPKEIPTKSGKNMIANISAWCTLLDDGSNIEPFYRTLSFWGDVGKKVTKIIIGHKYHANLVKNRSVDSLSAWDPVDKTEFTDKGKFSGDVKEILDQMNVKKIEIMEAEVNVSKNRGEYIRIDCDILGRQIMTRGVNDIGMMFVVDESSEDLIYGNDENDEVSGGFTVFSDPQNLVYGEGSEISIIGRITRNSDNGRVAMNADCVIPIAVIPIEMTPVDEEDDIEMKTGDEPVIDPETLREIESGGDDATLIDEEESIDTAGNMFGEDE